MPPAITQHQINCHWLAKHCCDLAYRAVASVLRPKNSMPMQKAASSAPGGAATATLLPATLPTAVPAARLAAMRQSTLPSLWIGGARNKDSGSASTHCQTVRTGHDTQAGSAAQITFSTRTLPCALLQAPGPYTLSLTFGAVAGPPRLERSWPAGKCPAPWLGGSPW